MRIAIYALSLFVLLCAVGCTNVQIINFPPASETFVTSGDNPGTVPNPPYTPKGQIIVNSAEFHLPIPILGLIPLGCANADTVYQQLVQPEIEDLGADALIGLKVDYNCGATPLMNFFGIGFWYPSSVSISGTAVKR